MKLFMKSIKRTITILIVLKISIKIKNIHIYKKYNDKEIISLLLFLYEEKYSVLIFGIGPLNKLYEASENS